MSLQIKEGGFCRAENGKKVGPMKFRSWSQEFPWESNGDSQRIWRADGTRFDPCDTGMNLVAEWVEAGPIRTVTRKEIVPGCYGPVYVSGIDAASHTRALVSLHSFAPPVLMKADELRAAAATFIALAEALEQDT